MSACNHPGCERFLFYEHAGRYFCDIHSCIDCTRITKVTSRNTGVTARKPKHDWQPAWGGATSTKKCATCGVKRRRVDRGRYAYYLQTGHFHGNRPPRICMKGRVK